MEEHKNTDSNVSHVVVRIEEDAMLAYVCIESSFDNSEDAMEVLLEEIKIKGIVEGIEENVLKNIIEKRIYNQEVIIAKGLKARDGVDGYYSVPIIREQRENLKPKILQDGSVDYSCFGDICMVYQGDEVARYIKAKPAVHGITVTGQKLIGKNGRDLRKLNTSGVQISEDNVVYTAMMDGKLEYVENKTISIRNIFEVKGDVTVATGNIDFGGDIHIIGNINSGMLVKASGNITVDGHVEGATLIAGKNIVLKNGMQGSQKGYIEAGGNISGKFFEQAIMRCKGSVNANSIMNCDIQSEDSIIISGKFGILVGGNVSAFFKVEGTMIGNLAERRTYVKVGSMIVLNRIAIEIGTKITMQEQELEKILQALQQIEAVLKKCYKEELNKKKLQLLRIKITKDTELTQLKEKHKEISNQIRCAQRCSIVVHKSIYRGVILDINDSQKILTSENYNITYQKRDGEIVFFPNT